MVYFIITSYFGEGMERHIRLAWGWCLQCVKLHRMQMEIEEMRQAGVEIGKQIISPNHQIMDVQACQWICWTTAWGRDR